MEKEVEMVHYQSYKAAQYYFSLLPIKVKKNEKYKDIFDRTDT